jgi:hypothetical protein
MAGTRNDGLSSRIGALAARLLALVAIVAALAAVGAAGNAGAALGSSYVAVFPTGTCAGSRIDVPAPTSVSPYAQDTLIAWRVQLWRHTQSGWVKDVASAWQWADVSGGSAFAP